MGKSKPLGRMDLIPTETWQDLARAHHTATGGGGEEMVTWNARSQSGLLLPRPCLRLPPQNSSRADYGRQPTTRTSRASERAGGEARRRRRSPGRRPAQLRSRRKRGHVRQSCCYEAPFQPGRPTSVVGQTRDAGLGYGPRVSNL